MPDASERFVVVSDDDEWTRRVRSSSAFPVERVPTERADAPDTTFDGYPAAVIVDGTSDADPLVAFGSLRDAYPDTACLLAGGGGRVDHGGADADGRPVVLEYVPARTPSAVAAAAEFAVERRTHRSYPLAEREDDRVASARALDVDRLYESAGLDDLASASVRAVDAEAATVALLGEYRLRIVGASDSRLPAVVDRARSVSTYTVLEGDVHEVPDLAADPRFEAHSRAVELNLRSYLGAPLRVDGVAVGSLSVFRSEPGTATAADREMLRLHASVAEDLLAAARPAAGADSNASDDSSADSHPAGVDDDESTGH